MTRLSRRRVARGLILVLWWLPTTVAVAAPRELPDFSRLVTRYGTAVVNISVTRDASRSSFPDEADAGDSGGRSPRGRRFFEPDPEPAEESSLGSGFIVSPDGYILTCAHVVDRARDIQVRLNDRREYSARLIGSDRRSDIALLKIETGGLPTVVIGDAAKLNVGEWVLAIGSPFGFDNSATVGIVSAKGRTLPNENYMTFIQTDVPINPGNSGGPLFNLKGEVVGVNSQIYSGTGGFMGVSFAIPIDAAITIGTRLKSEGRVRRGWLGVSLQDVTRTLAHAYGLDRPRGALVADILPRSPAAKSDLRPGDIVIEYEGKPIQRSSDLPTLVGLTMPGTHARFRVYRRDQGMLTAVVALGELKEERSSAPRPVAYTEERLTSGLILGELTPQLRRELGMEYGTVVSAVEGGYARDAGLRAGDVIFELDGKRVADTASFYRLLAHVAPGRATVLRVRRGSETLYLALEKDNRAATR